MSWALAGAKLSPGVTTSKNSTHWGRIQLQKFNPIPVSASGMLPHGIEDPVEKLPRPPQYGKRKKARNLFKVLRYVVLNPRIQFLWLEAVAPTQNLQGATEGLLKYPDASLPSCALV